MKSRITELLGIKYPIFQGGMAWVADGDLAGAVSNAGGLGIIGGGNAPKEVVKANIDRVKQITDKPFGVNIMLLANQEADNGIFALLLTKKPDSIDGSHLLHTVMGQFQIGRASCRERV